MKGPWSARTRKFRLLELLRRDRWSAVPLTRKSLLVLSTAAVALGAFIGTSYATAPDSEIDPGLPAHALPNVSVPAETRAAIQNLLTPEAVEQFGITTGSYSNIRKLADTEVGTVYVLPGTGGLCVALVPTLSCGNPSDGAGMVAVLVPVSSGEYVVGGGVLAAGITRVAFRREDGTTATATPVPGGFSISPEQRIKPGEMFDMTLG